MWAEINKELLINAKITGGTQSGGGWSSPSVAQHQSGWMWRSDGTQALLRICPPLAALFWVFLPGTAAHTAVCRMTPASQITHMDVQPGSHRFPFSSSWKLSSCRVWSHWMLFLKSYCNNMAASTTPKDALWPPKTKKHEGNPQTHVVILVSTED